MQHCGRVRYKWEEKGAVYIYITRLTLRHVVLYSSALQRKAVLGLFIIKAPACFLLRRIPIARVRLLARPSIATALISVLTSSNSTWRNHAEIWWPSSSLEMKIILLKFGRSICANNVLVCTKPSLPALQIKKCFEPRCATEESRTIRRKHIFAR